ncbi:MAG: sulfotransferase [Phycisphaerales bacterium]|nr:sulfotransferase [Phycisphaerales bacterium]
MIGDPRQLGASAYASGRFEDAVTQFERALRDSPRDPDLLGMLGATLNELGRCEEALKHLRLARARRPDHPETLVTFASASLGVGRLDEAEKAIERLRRTHPDHPRAIHVLTRIHLARGNADAASDVVIDALDRGVGDASSLVAYADVAPRANRTGDAITRLRAAEASLDPASRRSVLFALARLLDLEASYDDAFEVAIRANAMVRPRVLLDTDAMLETWTFDAFDSIGPAPADDGASARAVFLVGMPRSGTTLTERLIASHSRGAGVGESLALPNLARRTRPDAMTGEDLAALGRSYLDQTRADADRVADKMPENWTLVPLIRAALPGAAIVHCRRDPRDTCLSCFLQNFGDHVHYAFDLETCAAQYVRCDRAMREAARRVPIVDWAYEQVVADTEWAVRRLLDAIGLDFEPGCLEYHARDATVMTASRDQVRRAIYGSSVGRWKNYERHLGPLLKALDPVLETR